MSPNTKAVINLVVNLVLGLGGVIVAAAQPANGWQWVQFVAGLAMAIAGVIRGTWNETPGSAGGAP